MDEFIAEGEGLKTNVDFHKRVLKTKEFREGKHHIGFVEGGMAI